MRLLVHDRARAGLLIICLSLIGGTGCITASIINNAQNKAARQAYAEKRKKEIEDYKLAAEQGDLHATTRLGIEYIRGLPGIDLNIPQGVSLLEQAAAKQYGPAEYALGSLLVMGRSDYQWVSSASGQLSLQPLRGIALLKQSATRACAYSLLSANQNNRFPAYEISELYRSGRIIAEDKEQADLWLSRSILHCRHPNAYVIQNKFFTPKAATPQAQIDTMAWLLMMPSSDVKAKLQAVMSPADMQTAERQMTRLRQAVIESEKQYPAPAQPAKP